MDHGRNHTLRGYFNWAQSIVDLIEGFTEYTA